MSIYLSLVNFNIRTKHKNLTPFLVAAKYSRKDTVLWMLENDDLGANDGRINFKLANVDGRNALHLTALDKQSAYTIEVPSHGVACTLPQHA